MVHFPTCFHSKEQNVVLLYLGHYGIFKPLIALELNGSYIVTSSGIGTRDYFLLATLFFLCTYVICIFKINPDWDFNVRSRCDSLFLRA